MPQPQEEQKLCHCIEGKLFSCTKTHLAGNHWRGEISVEVCLNCGQYWLNLLYEPNIYEDSEDGEYYRGPISAHVLESIPEGHENILIWALNILASLDWYYCHHFWDSHGEHKTSGPFALLLIDHRSSLLAKWQKEHQGRR